MKQVKKQRELVFVLVFVLLLAGILLISFKPEFTGNVIGDGILDEGEQCDGGLGCVEGVCGAGFVPTEPLSLDCSKVPVCGDSVLDTGEVCDDGNVADNDGCSSVCAVEPPVCGDGFIWGDEVCDGNINVLCNTANGYAGVQNCSSGCIWEECITTLSCGDTILNGNEACEGSDFGTHTCVEQGFTTGSLTCNSDCTLNTGACTTCTEDWSCPQWDTIECVDGTETRTCTDVNDCGTTTSKPSESQDCSAETISAETSAGEEETDTSITTQTTQEPPAGPATCSPAWQCNEWSECVDETQARECFDAGNCGTEEGRPAASQACVPLETCFDGIKNQDERGVDCGGVCEKRCSVFTIVGSAVTGTFDTSKKFVLEKVFANKTINLVVLGVLVAGIIGFLAFKFLSKRKK